MANFQLRSPKTSRRLVGKGEIERDKDEERLNNCMGLNIPYWALLLI